MTDPGH